MSSAPSRRLSLGLYGQRPGARALVGPNAILQLSAALESQFGSAFGQGVFRSAGFGHYIDTPPTALVSEIEASRLFVATRAALTAVEADAVLAEAGGRTADYVLAHRIPRLAQQFLLLVPTWFAARAFLRAIKAHAWTFAGSGTVTIDLGGKLTMTITDNPLATPGCPWHVAVIERMFQRAVNPAARVTHAVVDAADQFLIDFPPRR